MTAAYEAREKAEGKIRLAMTRMAEKYPFHTHILERFVIVARPEVGTMAVAPAKDGVLLYHNPDFVLSLRLDELVGVLLHESHHVLFKHIFADPRDYPDIWARTVAEEVTVNEFVSEPLPEGCITLDLFPKLRPMESTDRRYKQLKKRRKRFDISPPDFAAKPESEAESSSPSESQAPEGRRGQDHGKVCVVDNHDVWREADSDNEGARTAAEAIIADAVIEVGCENVPEELRDIVSDLGIGDTPGDTDQELQGDGVGHVDWRRLLRRYVGQVTTVRPVFNRPPRRFPELVGIMPGKRRQQDRPRILAVIDTSGSISDELLEEISAELSCMARQHEVIVAECDCEIHAVYRYRPIESVAGRGGTDLRPVFRRKFLRKHRPDLIVYFTDGYGDAPAKAPSIPVVWCLSPDGRQPAEWGRVIDMHGPLSTLADSSTP